MPSAVPSPERKRSWYTEGFHATQSSPSSCRSDIIISPDRIGKDLCYHVYEPYNESDGVLNAGVLHAAGVSFRAHFKSLIESHSMTILMDVNQYSINLYHETISVRLSNAAALSPDQ
jgi:hypothetical protein